MKNKITREIRWLAGIVGFVLLVFMLWWGMGDWVGDPDSDLPDLLTIEGLTEDALARSLHAENVTVWALLDRAEADLAEARALLSEEQEYTARISGLADQFYTMLRDTEEFERIATARLVTVTDEACCTYFPREEYPLLSLLWPQTAVGKWSQSVPDEFFDTFVYELERAGIPEAFTALSATLWQESDWSADAVGKAGELGCAQILTGTFPSDVVRVPPSVAFDCHKSIRFIAEAFSAGFRMRWFGYSWLLETGRIR